MVGGNAQKNLHGIAGHQRPAPLSSAAHFAEVQYGPETSRAEEFDAAEIKYQRRINLSEAHQVVGTNEAHQVVGDMSGVASVNLAADFDNH